MINQHQNFDKKFDHKRGFHDLSLSYSYPESKFINIR
jgi:hypothetical protein